MSGDYVPHVVRPGDYLAKLAFTRGFDAAEVWAHEKNDALRALRPDPDLLAPGDILFVPAKAEPKGLPLTAGSANRYTAKVPKVDVHLVVHDDAGKPLASEPYRIEGLGAPTEGTSGPDGAVSFSAPVHLREVGLVLTKRNARLLVRVGDLDPPDEGSGAAMRLEHLGYLARGARSPERVEAAIAAFQRAAGLPSTGALDDDTRKALESAHGS